MKRQKRKAIVAPLMLKKKKPTPVVKTTKRGFKNHNVRVTMASGNNDRCTPLWLVKRIEEFFGRIDLDPCSNSKSLVNAKRTYDGTKYDGLVEPWRANAVYVNPPYGRDKVRKTNIKHWIKKAAHEYQACNADEIILLVPARVGAKWFQQHVIPYAAATLFFHTRLMFEGCKDPAPFDNVLVYYGMNVKGFVKHFGNLGWIPQKR